MKPLPANKLSRLLPPVRKYRYVPEEEYEFFENSGARPFDAKAGDFQLVNAWWLMDAAMLAYSKERIVEHWCRKAGFRNVEWFSSKGTQCYVAACEDYIFVVFRGADPPKRFRNFIIDWKINARLSLVDFKILDGYVHGGFLKALKKVSSIDAARRGTDLQDCVRSLSRDYPKAKIWFTGHSQGAALASLAAVQYVRNGGKAQLYTFGSPKIGDRTLQEAFDSLKPDLPAWRIVNSSDIVTRLPLFGLYFRSTGFFKWPFIGRYRSVGKLQFIDDHGAVGTEKVWHRGRLRILTYIPHKIRMFFRRFTNHAPIHYAIRLSNAMTNAKTKTFPAVSAGEADTGLSGLQWAAIVACFVFAFGGGILFGLRWWLGIPREDPGPVVIIENGLGADREDFYSLAEGSEMFPLAIAQSLRFTPDEIEKMSLGQKDTLLDTVTSWFKLKKTRLVDNLDKFGFIKVPITPKNPLGYIGLTVARREGTGVEMLGVNCAACHVGQMEHNGKAVRVDGAPNMLDIFGFVDALSASVRPTRLTHINLVILAKEAVFWVNEFNVNGLRLYEQQLQQHKLLKAQLKPLNGRADAFGTARSLFFGDFRELSSPASYPHLWGLAKTEWYHWNANTNSIIQRNVGQALGLGAGIDKETCKTTIRFDALDRLETLASKLTAPAWPSEFEPIDATLRDLGEKIYLGVKPFDGLERGCAGCHDNYYMKMENGRPLNDYRLYSLNEVGTDPNEALNFVPGVMVNKSHCNGNEGETEWMGFDKAHEVFLGGVRLDASVAKVSDLNFSVNGARAQPQWKTWALCGKESRDCPVYPAKPLVGIWATAPYLHNGSVSSIADLLKPASERPRSFHVGYREYDVKTLGYAEPPESTKEKFNEFKTTLNGNLNTGHEYGTKLEEREKLALIEFLKSLKEGDQERLQRIANPGNRNWRNSVALPNRKE